MVDAVSAREVHDERSNRLVAFAYLNAIHQADQNSYSDLLAELLVRLLADASGAMTATQLSDATEAHIGMRVPTETVAWCLGLKSALRHVRADGGWYTYRGPTRPALAQDRAALLREEANLIEDLVAFAAARIEEAWGPDRARAALELLVERHTLGLEVEHEAPTDSGSIDARVARRDRVVVAEWASKLLASDPVRVEFLGNMVKGRVLAAAVVDARRGQYTSKFRHTSVFLDTPEVLGALGYHDEAERVAIRRGLKIAAAAGARISVLESTVTEVRAVILQASYPNDPSKGGGTRVRSYFAGEGTSVADIRLAADELETHIERLGYTIAVGQTLSGSPAIDEAQLREELKNHVHSRNGGRSITFDRGSAVDYDARALISVHVARGNRGGDRLESSGAVLLTSNARLVKVANAFPGMRGGNYSIALGLHNFLNLMWLRSPAEFTEMPIGRLALECASLLTPTPQAWAQFQKNLVESQEKGDISADQLALSIYSQGMRGEVALAEARGTAITYEFTRAAALRRDLRDSDERSAEAGTRARLEAERDIARMDAEVARIAADEAKAKQAIHDKKWEQISRRVATTVYVVIVVPVLVAIAVVLALWFYNEVPDMPKWLRVSGATVLVLLAVVPLALKSAAIRARIARAVRALGD